MTTECEQVIESGAYVLGILEPDERAAYERHLHTCPICQAEVADFAGLPQLLAQLDPAEAAAVGDAGVRRLDDARQVRADAGAPDVSRFETKEPSPVRALPSVPRSNPAADFGDRRGNARTAQRRQRRWRTAAAALAAAACLAVGVLVGARFLGAGPSTAPREAAMVAMTPVTSDVPINAQVRLTSFVGGTDIRMHCVYAGGHAGPRWALKLLVYPKNGGPAQQVSTWTAAHGEDITLSATSSLPPSQIGRVEMVKGTDTTLLQYTPA